MVVFIYIFEINFVFFRFQKVVWGSSSGDADKPKGYLVCGTDKGGLEVYDPHKIINNEEDCLVWSVTKHTGPVRSLDFNIHQVCCQIFL